MLNQNDVTIVIPHLGETKEQEYSFNECYASLRETAPEVKIVVAKNGAACTHPRDVRVVSQGQCKAVNAAVAITDTPWIMVTNDDMIYPPEWFQRLTNFPQEYVNPLCVSPKLIEPRPGAPTFEVFFAGGAGGDFDKKKFYEFASEYYHSSEVRQLRTGFNLPFLIRRDVWETVGGYDINYDPWGSNSDSDLLYKIKLAGVQPYQETNAIVYHFSQTSGTFEPRNQNYWHKNWNYFIEKWGFPRTDDRIWEADFKIPGNETRIFTPEWVGRYDRN